MINKIPEIKILDYRMCRPVAVRIKSKNCLAFFNKTKIIEADGRKFYFLKPNNVAIYLTKVQEETKKAINIYKDRINPKFISENCDVEFEEDEISFLYDYFGYNGSRYNILLYSN